MRWDEHAAVTPNGHLIFFAEFLTITGVFGRWVSSCPLSYRSGNAPDKRDVLGTLILAMLVGHKRYAHITALRGDAVAAQALGMDRIVSEDALRRAMERIDEAASTAWMRLSLMHSVREAAVGAGHRHEHQAAVRTPRRCRDRRRPNHQHDDSGERMSISALQPAVRAAHRQLWVGSASSTS